jgi:sugar phosphate isomerase/epimerase
MHIRLQRRDFLKASAALGLAGMTTWNQHEEAHASTKDSWPFYAFDNGLAGVTSPEDKCRLLQELGYDGIECHLNATELPQMLEQLDKYRLKLFGIYTTPWLEDPLPRYWGDWIRLLKGRNTRIEMAIRSRNLKPSDIAGDPLAETLIKGVSDLCADSGPVVSIYPHADMWTERVDDGVRLATRLQRKNVGTNFNLVHWQWVRQTRPLEIVMREAFSHLRLVTVNGLKGPANGRQRIRPLDETDYDLRGFLSLVRKVGYSGPVGLQCYSVAEPPVIHLKRSIETWRLLTATPA